MKYEVDINIKSDDLDTLQKILDILNGNSFIEVKESVIYDCEEHGGLSNDELKEADFIGS
mgnify:CR=1 FL=1